MYNKISNSNILLVVTKVALCPVPIQKTQKKKHRKWLQAFKETTWNFRLDTFNSCPVNLAFPSQLFSLSSFSNGSTELGKRVIGKVRLKANLNIFFYLFILTTWYLLDLPPTATFLLLLFILLLISLASQTVGLNRLNTLAVSSKLLSCTSVSCTCGAFQRSRTTEIIQLD